MAQPEVLVFLARYDTARHLQRHATPDDAYHVEATRLKNDRQTFIHPPAESDPLPAAIAYLRQLADCLEMGRTGLLPDWRRKEHRTTNEGHKSGMERRVALALYLDSGGSRDVCAWSDVGPSVFSPWGAEAIKALIGRGAWNAYRAGDLTAQGEQRPSPTDASKDERPRWSGAPMTLLQQPARRITADEVLAWHDAGGNIDGPAPGWCPPEKPGIASIGGGRHALQSETDGDWTAIRQALNRYHEAQALRRAELESLSVPATDPRACDLALRTAADLRALIAAVGERIT
jgi:hypothetical protein